MIQGERRLLVVSCSQRKRADAASLPAIERYIGPTYQVLRRYLSTVPANDLDTLVLSAEYGLIDVRHPVRNYDRRMSASRAYELQGAVLASWAALTSDRHYRDIYVYLGEAYRMAFDPCLGEMQAGVTTCIATGSQGKRLADLHRWLYQDQIYSRATTADHAVQHASAKPVRIGGQQVNLSADDVLVVARMGLSRAEPSAVRCQAWYVPVDGSRVSPKWLVSQATGIAVRDFHSQDARRVLGELGIEVLPL